MEMEGVRRIKQVQTFGDWNNFYNEIPISGHYFHKDVDLFKVPHSKPKPLKENDPEKEKNRNRKKKEQWKHGRVTPQQQQRQMRQRTSKAVDEDLYKIPPEFLHKKPKEKMVACGFLKRCIGLSCIP